MTSNGASGLGTVLSIVALGAIAGFMYWLNQRSGELPEATAEAPIEDIVPSNAADILANPAAVVGDEAQIDTIGVALGLGQGAFSLALDDSTAYPVLLNADAIQRLRMRSMQVYGGDRVYVHGTIFTVNDSIRALWVEQGFVDETMAANIPITPSFILADTVDIH